MAVAVATAQAFRPPPAPRNKGPLGALGILAALARNPLEIWSRFPFRAAGADRQDLLRLCAPSSTTPPRSGACSSTMSPTTARTRCSCACCARASAPACSPPTARRGAPAPHARAAVFAAPGRGLRPRHAPRRARGGRRHRVAPRRRHRRREEEMALVALQGAGADAVQPGPRARAERVPAGGDALFQHHRPDRPARRARRAGFPAAHRPPARQGFARPFSPSAVDDIIAARKRADRFRRRARRPIF